MNICQKYRNFVSTYMALSASCAKTLRPGFHGSELQSSDVGLQICQHESTKRLITKAYMHMYVLPHHAGWWQTRRTAYSL